MSLSESSSEDYYQIIDSFLNTNNYKEWDQIPQITYMTFKAILNHMANLQQKISKNYELTTQLSLKIRDANISIQQLEHQNFGKQTLTPSRKESGFKKKKYSKNAKMNQFQVNEFQRSMSKIGNQKNRSSFNYNSLLGQEKQKKAFLDVSLREPQNSIAEGLNETMLEQVKAMAEAILEQNKFVKRQQLTDFEAINKKNLEKMELRLNKEISTIDDVIQGKFELLDKNMIDIEIKFSKKVREDQEWLYKFIQQNCLMKNQLGGILQAKEYQSQKLFIQKQKYFIEQENKKSGKDKKQINKQSGYILSKKCSMKKNGSCESLQREKTFSNKAKSRKQVRLLTQNNEDFRDFKVKVLKDISERMKTVDVERLFDAMQKELTEKYKKINIKCNNLDKKLQQICLKAKSLPESPQKPIVYKKHSHIESKSSLMKQKTIQIDDNSYKIQKQEKKSDYKKVIRSLQKSITSLEISFQQKLQKNSESLRIQFGDSLNKKQKKILQQFEERQKLLCQVLEQNVSQLKNSLSSKNSQNDSVQKLNKAVTKIAQQMVIARYLYFGQEQCNDLIHWEKQTINTMSENYIWRNGKPIVTVIASGLYKIEAGIYEAFQSFKFENPNRQLDNNQEIAYLLLNGEPISTFNMIKDIPKLGSAKASIGMKARGNIFCEPVLLPAKSQISIKVANRFYGQAYMQILQL